MSAGAEVHADLIRCSLARLQAKAARRAAGYLDTVLAAAVSISGDDVFLTRADRDAIRARYDALERIPDVVVEARRAKCLPCQWRRQVNAFDYCDFPSRKCSRLILSNFRETCPIGRWQLLPQEQVQPKGAHAQ